METSKEHVPQNGVFGCRVQTSRKGIVVFTMPFLGACTMDPARAVWHVWGRIMVFLCAIFSCALSHVVVWPWGHAQFSSWVDFSTCSQEFLHKYMY